MVRKRGRNLSKTVGSCGNSERWSSQSSFQGSPAKATMTQTKYLFAVFFFFTLFVGVFLVGPSDRMAEWHPKREPRFEFRLGHPSDYDTAMVNVSNNAGSPVYVWIQTTECYMCSMVLLGAVEKHDWGMIEADTSWPIELKITTEDTLMDNNSHCDTTLHLKENGNYSWYINVNHSVNTFVCNIVLRNAPPDVYIPIYVAIAALFGMAIFYIIFKQLWKTRSSRFFNYIGLEREVSTDLGTPSHPTSSDINHIQRAVKKDKPKRLTSLDAFRGMSLVIMIFVNYGGGGYWFFTHAKWNGLTVADLVFPWFIWIMGVSITLSFHALIRHGVSRWVILRKIAKRFCILFALGLILDGGTDLANFRVPGVLQRIAASYVVVATLHAVSARPRDESRQMSAWYANLRDILDYWYEWLVILGIVALHVCLTFFLPVPDCPTGYLGPGGPLVGVNGSLANCTGGAATYIDKVIFTANHTYKTCTARHIYQLTTSHDPEGILGTLTAIFTAFLGLQAGKILHLFQHSRERIVRLLLWCLLLGVIAGALCGFSKEEGLIPVNKNLWSLSFTLATASMAFFLLAIFYYLIDVKFWWTGVPFIFLGMNSIVAYCGSEVMGGHFPFSWSPVYGTHAEKLAMNLIGASLWAVITFYMFTVNMFIKI